ncbi:MAG: methylated-DNA--[protein]-cysteine S-methyltransferase [Chitinophagales bacterium]|nr:methylated-DNA--[protein]-cysteine S-methyltransferase [Chitinophagales bacterium]MCZ2393746.1 methylated-DNA--[protein]-cysteine S-methyltransferase [Chitinophagales bacterium]
MNTILSNHFIYTVEYKTPFGVIILGEYNQKLCYCDWLHRKMHEQIRDRLRKKINAEFQEKNTDFLQNVSTQLDEYFQKNRITFDIPLLLAGTDFQKKVWNELLNIPYGKTISYIELSRRLKSENAIRAVASANGANAISIIVPCHRVIGNNGALVGYAGGLNAKKKLLELEQAYLQTTFF